ncbi:hypothetical protein GJ496_004932 [Pomphorhynchus laevis]|nr:hypothetical protein GJ496_004932 [Pomphorhynchus laevis]KAI0982398.1 hypothetical protein GJ496_004932 [Pomphorhynchus laevis]
MSVDNSSDFIKLSNELRELKAKLEEKKHQLNDIELFKVAERLEPIVGFLIKPRRILKCGHSKVLDMDWCVADRRRMITTSQDGKLIIWDVFTSTKEHIISTPTTWVMACAYSPSGSMVACGGLDNKVTCYEVETNQENNRKKHVIATHGQYISCCKFFHSDHQFITASGDSTAKLWDVETGQSIQVFDGHSADIMDIDITSSELGNVFATGSSDRTALIWDIRSGNYVHICEGHKSDVNCVKFHPTGDGLMTGSDDAACRLFDLRADRLMGIYTKESIIFPCNDIDFSTSGRLLFAGYGDYCINVWDVLKGLRVAILYGHENKISAVNVSPDGTCVASGSWDSTIRVWA